MATRALIFDVFGTVVDWRSGIAREVTRLLGPDVAAEALADAWRERYAPSMDRVRRGERPWTSLDALHRESLRELLPAFVKTDIEEPIVTELVLGWHRLPPWPDAVAGLVALEAHFVIAPLSNGNVSLLVDLAKAGKLPWNAIFSAELFEHYKPDPETYDGVVRLLGLRPDEVMMVAAHTSDLAAARARGLRTAYVHRPLEFGPTPSKAPPAHDPYADFNVGSLVELAAQLDSRPR